MTPTTPQATRVTHNAGVSDCAPLTPIRRSATIGDGRAARQPSMGEWGGGEWGRAGVGWLLTVSVVGVLLPPLVAWLAPPAVARLAGVAVAAVAGLVVGVVVWRVRAGAVRVEPEWVDGRAPLELVAGDGR